MMIKNTFKLVTTNFYTFWKMFLYKIIVALVAVGLIAVVFPTIKDIVVGSGFVTELSNYIQNVLVFPNIIVALQSVLALIVACFNAVSQIFASNPLLGIYLIFVLGIFIPTLSNMGEVPFGECIYVHMASLSKSSFVNSYIRKFGSSIVYSVLKTLITLVLGAVTFVCSYFTLRLITINSTFVYFVPILLFAVVIVLISLWQTVLSGWMPATVVFNDGAIKGFRQGFRTVARRFFKTLSSLMAFNFLTLLLIYMFNFYILVVLIPFYSVFIITFKMVMFFGSHGMGYNSHSKKT